MVECAALTLEAATTRPRLWHRRIFSAAYDFLTARPMDRDRVRFPKHSTFFGNEIVAGTRRLALMNMFLQQHRRNGRQQPDLARRRAGCPVCRYL